MKIAKSVEQACSILAVIAEHHGQPVTGNELNERLGVSSTYLAKIARKLVIGGIINSAQGVNGGFVLAKPMNAITLRAVVEIIEGTEPMFTSNGTIERVFLGRKPAARRGLRALTLSFASAERAWWHELGKITMEDLITSSLRGDDNA